MKKILILTIFIILGIYSVGFSYDITPTDYENLVQTTNKLEDYISKKGENQRASIIKQIEKIKLNQKNNDKTQTLLNKIILNIKDNSNINIQNKIIDELNKNGITDLKFIYSTGALNNMPFVLYRLLQNKKDTLHEILQISTNNIQFDTLQKYKEDDNLGYLFNLIMHYDYVNTNAKTREIIDNFQPIYNNFINEFIYSKKIYEFYKKISKDKNLNTDQKTIVNNTIKAFELNGINLTNDKITRLQEINQQLTKLSTSFSRNMVDDEKGFYYQITDLEKIKELPEDILETTKKEAENQGKQGYIFGINNADYLMGYSSDQKIREEIRNVYKNIATTGSYDNRPIIVKILQLRQEMALILGYKNFGEYSLANKMAGKPEIVINQEDQILSKAKEKGQKEIDEIKEYFGLTGLNVRDYTYYSRKLKENKYQFDTKILEEYFEYENVIKGLFNIANKLYGLEFKKINIKLYNDDINAYEVYKDGKLKGYYITDYFYNPNKGSGAWADVLRGKKVFKNGTRLPIVVNVLNIEKGEDIILLNYNEVNNIFHEFGHAIHGLLSESNYSDLNGFNVERDFVELPSQLMEEWTNGEGLKTFAYHYKTGKQISDEIIEKMNKLDTFSSGIGTTTQIIYSKLDLLLHTNIAPNSVDELDKSCGEIIESTGIFKNDLNNKFYASFSHIFDGGYSAGYYSYLRAEIIESDIFTEFEKNGIFNKDIADKFYKTILSQGSRKHAFELFKDFMGRDIELDGLYKKKGFK